MAFFQAGTLWVNQLADGVAVLVLDVPDRKVNVLGPQALTDLEEALARIGAETSFRLLIIRSGKPNSFCAGADVREFAAGGSAADYAALSARGQQLFEKLANLRVPSAAVIGGACLGGGLELALACDYRVVVDKPDTRLGFPEIELGLIPGWGGTQQLPRVVGLEHALQMILGGRRLGAEESLRWGLADSLTDEPEQEPSALLAEPKKRPRPDVPLSTWRAWALESNWLGRRLIFRGARHVLQQRLPDDMPAPWEALEAVKIGVQKGMAAGLAYEREAIGRLATSPACRHLVDLFLQREQTRKIPALPEGRGPIRRIGIIGAGTMGAGIAQLAVLHGCEVVVREAGETALGLAMLRLMALLQRAADRGVFPASEMNGKLANIHGTTAWKGFENVDLVVEAATEDLALKKKLFQQAEEHTAANTILASNTSSLRIQDIQDSLMHPERVAGLHFFNPVHKMPLVEVARTPATSQDVINLLMAWAATLGKTPLVVRDSPGFVVNRVLMPYFNEAVLLVSEGMSIERVDEAMRRFGMPMGPLEVLDQVGLDVAAYIARAVAPVFGERFQLQPAFALMAERQWLGVKTKAGFYRYRGRKKNVNRLAVNALRAASEADAPYGMEAMSRADQLTEVRERLVGLMVNEAARCLEEGLAEDANAIDLAMVLGSGWAPHRGGPLCYAREQGRDTIIDSLIQLAQRLGERFQPCEEIKRL